MRFMRRTLLPFHLLALGFSTEIRAMAWLAGGVVYSIAYLLAGSYLRGSAQALLWLRITALLVPPLAGVLVIAWRRRDWTGCQWLFWATIALGLSMIAIGIVGWTVDELLLARETSWQGWYTVFALFGTVAPLFALLAQPHRGAREPIVASTAVDIAGIAVMTGYLYSHFVVASDLTPLSAPTPSMPLVWLEEFQQLLVCAALIVAAVAARGSAWAPVYRRLGAGLIVSFTILSISNLGILQGLYWSGGVYDLVWIMPFPFFAWAAASAPKSADSPQAAITETVAPSPPWVVFGALGALPLVDFGLRRAVPIDASLEGFRDISMVITIFSVLPLLIARLAVENSDARRADRRRQLLAAATEEADDLISIMTPAGQVEYANSAFCRALAWDQQEVAQKPASDFLAEESLAELDSIRNEALLGKPWHGTLVRRRRDGSTFLSAGSIVALAGRPGEVANLVAVERDTTHEAQLRDQLIHSERLAAVGQLVSGVAHELNNPLQSVLGFTELLIAEEHRPSARHDLEQVSSAARRAAKIVRNLLAFVRRSSIERDHADLNDIVQNTVALQRYELGTAGIKLEETYAPNLPQVLVNREEVQQIVLNVMLNAEHAMKSGGLRGRISVRTFAAGANVAVEIQDDGPGVPHVMAGKIFEPFFSTKSVGEGTGLGLSLALGIAEAHGGKLALIPAASGACFRLTLPGSEAAAAPCLPAEIRTPAVEPGRRRALVVDDEPSIRQMLERLLNQRGFVVDLAEDGQPACGLLEQHHYEVIFCDLQLPNMSGLELIEWIRKRQPTSSSVLVLVTGGLLTPEMQSSIEAACVIVLPKPFGAAALDSLLAQSMTASSRA
jgi:PAS domain S-box-containing protein